MAAPLMQPVVAIVGHIDHGKTTLLDYIRTATVAAGEQGGITQRVSAYEAIHKTKDGERLITFIDTPGHEAFGAMRRRASHAADIAILIVAADDGVKPQTQEAIKAVQEAGIPFIVAFTKIDKNTANIEKAKESVLREGVYLENLGGDVPWVAISSKTGEGVPELLDLILLVAEVGDMKNDTAAPVQAIVIESARDAKAGTSATVIIRQGTLTTGGFAVTGTAFAPLRSIENFAGKRVDSLTAGKPARIAGFTEEPAVGSTVTVVATKKEAEKMTADAALAQKKGATTRTDSTASDKAVMRLVLKADTQGSLEALRYELGKVTHPDVDVLIAGAGVGTINENDIKLVIGFSPAAILGFSVKVDGSAKDLAERQHIALEQRTIIYELSQWLTDEIAKHAPDRSAEAITGTAKIIKLFSATSSKHVVGARVESGTLKMGDLVTVFRRDLPVGTGKISNLQQQRSNVNAVGEGVEFGMQIDSKADIVGGDVIQVGGKKANG